MYFIEIIFFFENILHEEESNLPLKFEFFLRINEIFCFLFKIIFVLKFIKFLNVIKLY